MKHVGILLLLILAMYGWDFFKEDPAIFRKKWYLPLGAATLIWTYFELVFWVIYFFFL